MFKLSGFPGYSLCFLIFCLAVAAGCSERNNSGRINTNVSPSPAISSGITEGGEKDKNKGLDSMGEPGKKKPVKSKKQATEKSKQANSPFTQPPQGLAIFSFDEMNRVGEKYFSLLNEEKYDEIADLFHFPLEDTAKETIRDRKKIVKFHRLMRKEFGPVKRHSLLTMGMYAFNVVAIYTGKGEYWLRNPANKQFVYNVDFEKEGKGGIILQFCYINKKLELRMVQYGIPRGKKGSEETIKRLLEELIELRGNELNV